MSLIDYINPLRSIASELKIIRELYELDLAGREKPIIRQTEEAKGSDTEIFYGTEDDSQKSKLRQMLEGVTVTDEDEDDVFDRDR